MRLPFKRSGRFAARFGIVLPAGVAALLIASAAHAQDATWSTAPGSADFNTPGNWTPATVPTGTASFGTSTRTTLTFSALLTTINTFQFNAGAPAYTFNLLGNELDFNGAGGIVNNSFNAPRINTGGGTLTFNNLTTAANATIANSFGTVQFNNSSTAGTANINNNLGFMFFNNSSSAGSSSISNSGSITFANSSTAGNAAIVTQFGGFLLSFADSSSAGSATITTNAASEVQFTGSANGGTARFITTGTFDMSGLTSGGATAGSIEGAGTYFLGGNTLTVGSNNLSTTVSGTINDGGSFGGAGGALTKVGTGTLTLSGINTYTGATNVTAGTLEVDGSIATSSLVLVSAGAALSGVGTVSATGIAGTLAPGNPANPTGTLSIAGSIGFGGAAIYLTTIAGANASNVSATGNAALAGTVQTAFAAGASSKSYDILHSTGLGGSTFAGVTNVNPNYTASLSYSATDVFLNLTAQFGAGSNLDTNQQNVATALGNAFNAGTLPPQLASPFSLSGPALNNALSQLDGEVATGAEHGAIDMMTQFLGLMLDPFVDGRFGSGNTSGSSAIGFAPEEDQFLPSDVALAYASILNRAGSAPAPFVQRWTSWGAAYGGGNFTSGNTAVGSSNVNSQIFGFASGMDYHYSPDTVLGFALGGGGLNWGLAGGLGSGLSNAFQSGVYGITRFGPAYLGGSLAFANHWITTNRTALGDQLNANFAAQSYGARVEGGYRYAVLPALGVTPYGAVQLQDFHTPAYGESDLTGGGLGLNFASMNATDVRTEIGARLDSPMLIKGMPVILRGRLAWAHDFVSNPALGAVFQALPGTNFTVNGAAIPNDSALVSAGAEFFITSRWSLLAKFDGEFAPISQTYAGTGTLRYVW